MEHRYKDCLYSFNYQASNKKDVLKIANSKFPLIPTELCHYYNISPNSVNSLVCNYLYASHPFEFNDPFDCNKDLISFDNVAIDDILVLNNELFPKDYLIGLFESNKLEDRNKLNSHLTWLLFNVIYMKLGIFCMTDNYESMEMWTYYANHRGFVIKFDLAQFTFDSWGPFPINYTNDFEKIDYSILKTGSFIYQSNIKAQCWDHESEWRLLIYGPDVMKVPFRDLPQAHNRKFYYNPTAIKEIILGYSFFELNEYIQESSDEEKQVVILRHKRKLKRQILRYIFKNEIRTSMISIKRDSVSILGARQIQIIPISTNKYEIKYVG